MFFKPQNLKLFNSKIASVFKRDLSKNAFIKVKLNEDIEHLGVKGSIIDVKPGHMRHTLYPRKQAEYVVKVTGNSKYKNPTETEEQKLKLELELKQAAEQQKKPEVVAKKKIIPEEIAAKLEAISSLVFLRKPVATDSEQTETSIYGSVSKNDIVTLLRTKHEIAITKEMLDCEERFKNIGDHRVSVLLDQNISALLTISIQPLQ